ncbi:hypothetical protein [Arsenicibacter rosenii]|uniref:Uncharacterized protein n=1 Tax=Arsenicibacter rosenii TaxID=1750698 RepID=A0A1S2VHQ3_9BACT|nr:hypothetical protein [Arsenicibacter rosenii]OIN58272.1 hypothetical protein BLX24_14820 [Arsenicibacter rosenii]
MKTIHPAKTVHYLYITDESGIGDVFPAIKQNLVGYPSTHVSLIYASGTSAHVFAPELHILSRHFPTQFIPALVYDPENRFDHQATIETMLNANTRDQLKISVAGMPEFVSVVRDQLLFLGIKKETIHLHFLR